MLSELPTISEAVNELQGQETILGIFFIGIGLVFLLLGVRAVELLITASFAFVGFVIGQMLPLEPAGQWIVSGIAVVLLGVSGWFLTKMSVAILGGAWSGFVLASLAVRFGMPEEAALAVGAIGLIAAIALSFIMFEELVALITSFEGTLLIIAGIVVVLTHFPMTWVRIRPVLVEHPIVTPFFILAGTVSGFYFQLTELRQKETGMST
jgi:hypothetical protein